MRKRSGAGAGRGEFSPKLVARASDEEKKAAARRAAQIGINESELIRSALSIAFEVTKLTPQTERLLDLAGWGPSRNAIPGFAPAPIDAPEKVKVARPRRKTLPPVQPPAAPEPDGFEFTDLTKGQR